MKYISWIQKTKNYFKVMLRTDHWRRPRTRPARQFLVIEIKDTIIYHLWPNNKTKIKISSFSFSFCVSVIVNQLSNVSIFFFLGFVVCQNFGIQLISSKRENLIKFAFFSAWICVALSAVSQCGNKLLSITLFNLIKAYGFVSICGSFMEATFRCRYE